MIYQDDAANERDALLSTAEERLSFELDAVRQERARIASQEVAHAAEERKRAAGIRDAPTDEEYAESIAESRRTSWQERDAAFSDFLAEKRSGQRLPAGFSNPWGQKRS